MTHLHHAQSFRNHATATAEFIVHCDPCGHTKAGFETREDADAFATFHNETGALVVVTLDNGTTLATGTVEAPAVAFVEPKATTPAEPARVPARIDPAQARQIRAWAEKSGVDCPSRGRIPAAVLDRYNEVGGKPLRKRRTAAAK